MMVAAVIEPSTKMSFTSNANWNSKFCQI